jgi:DNA polymerase-3 subunit alpha
VAADGSTAKGVVVPPFVHLDVQSTYSALASPSSPDDYVRALVAQYPLDRLAEGTPQPALALAEGTPQPALALADTSLHSAVKMAVACTRAQVDHLVGLRVRVVPTRAYRAWGEQPGELILLAMDETGWLNLVALNNLGHLAGADRAGPRVDWQDLARHAEGLICLTGAPGTGLLSPAIERAANPAEPGEALGLARRLLALFGDRLYLELAFHGRAVDRLVNRGLVSLAERLEIPVVAANAVRYTGREDALPAAVLEAMRRGARAEGLLGSGSGGEQLPMLTLATRAPRPT